MKFCLLVDDGTDAAGSVDTPSEEGETSDGDDIGFNCEEMADLVDWEPDRGKGNKPEDEEGGEINFVGAGAGGHSGGLTVDIPAGPNGFDHELDTVAADPGLYAVPDTGHGGAVQDWPESAIDAEGGAGDDGESDVVDGTNTAGGTDEAGREEVADPRDRALEPGLLETVKI